MKKPFKNPFRHHRAKNRNKPRGYSPTQIICVSFVIVIALGTLLLSLPIASRYGRMRVIDAMFTATSATCVTGLVVRDTWTQFTVFGQAVILVLIQVGGLGLVTLTSFFALAMRRRMGFRDLRVLGESVSADGYAQAKDVLRIVVGLAALFEGIGILLLLFAFVPQFGPEGIWVSVFTAVSAFCNAGISTLSGNMYDPLVAQKYNLHVWIALLIVFGGLGFPIVFNYLKLLRHLLVNTFKIVIGQQKHYIHTPRIININTYIVMISTLVLLAGGTFFYYLLEIDNTLAGLPFRGQLANAFLGAVTPRTAGFCVADMGTLTTGTLMLTLILMIIGAAPMSTGGGLKVTTVCVALLTAHNAARGKENVEIRKREISPETIRRAFATIVFYFCWLGAAVWILSITEKDVPVFTLIFEVVSALSTVGLSLNFSPLLSISGKLVIIFTMLVGRIGILAFFISFYKEYKKKNYTYPQENILM